MGTKLVERGITRYDIEDQGTYGFMVRISREGNHINEFFSDKNNGGKRKALESARKRYRQLKRKLPPPQTTKGVRTRRNRSGVVGVHLAKCESVYGEEYSSYCASWKTTNGKRSKLSFSFKKYGKKKAWELACLSREIESSDRKKIEALYKKAKKANKKFPSVPKSFKVTKRKKTKKKKAVKKKKKAVKKKTAKKTAKKKKKATKKAAKKKKVIKKKAKRKKKKGKKR